MLSMRYAVVHYQEIALKKKNRPQFINRLIRNIKGATADLGVRKILKKTGRLVLQLSENSPRDLIVERLSGVFGIANFALAYRLPVDLDRVKKKIGEALLERKSRPGGDFASFRITTKRAFKGYAKTSMEVDREIGAYVKELTGARVDLTRPELTVHVELLPDEVYFFFDKLPGLGGLPVGTGGKVACLLSGGIDSPVAAYRMMQRGCEVIGVHFHSHPYLSKTSQEKVLELGEVLKKFQGEMILYLVSFGEIQREILLNIPPSYRIVLYRRLMLRIAEAIARREGALALITGESLGQVASQTLENISVIQEAAELPILRPLIAMDKEEITAQARKIGTYDISIIPDQDCCQLFTPKHPILRGEREAVYEAESKVDIPNLLEMGLKETVRRVI
jgi:thiamine biosynthesis protein ThiI